MDNELKIGARFDTAPITEGMDEAVAVTEQGTSSMSGFFAQLAQAVTGFGSTVRSAMMGAAESTTEATDVMKERFVETAEAAKVSGAGIGAAFSGIGALLGAGIFVTFAAEAIDSVVEINVELGHLADKTGLTVTALAGLQQMSKQMGMDFASVSTGLQFLLYNQSLAVTGSQKQIQAFQDLGVTLNDLKTLSPEEIFKKTSAAIGGETDKSAQLYHARTLLGRGGAALIPMMMKYKGTIDDAAQAEGKLTGITDDSVEASMRWQAASAKATEFLHSLAIPVIEHFGDVLMGILGVIDIFGAVVITVFEGVAGAIMTTIAPLETFAKVAWDLVHGNFEKAKEDAQGTAAIIKDIWKGVGSDVSTAWNQVKTDFTSHAEKAKHEVTAASPGTDVGSTTKGGKGVRQGNPDATFGAENKAAEDALKSQEANIKQSVALAIQGGEERAQAELDAIPQFIAAQQAYTKAKQDALDKDHDLEIKANVEQRKTIENSTSTNKTAELKANAKAKLDIEAKYQADKKNIASEGETAITQLQTQAINARTEILRKATQETVSLLEQESAEKARLAKNDADESLRNYQKDSQFQIAQVQQAEQQGLITRKAAAAQKRAILTQEGNDATAAYNIEKDKLHELIAAYQAQQATLSATSPEYKKITQDINQLAAALDTVDKNERQYASDVARDTAKVQSDVKLQTTTWKQFFQQYKTDSKQAADTFRLGFMDAINQLNAGIGNAFASWAVQGKSFGAVMQQVSGQILSGFVGMLVTMGLKWLESLFIKDAQQKISALSQVSSNAAVGGSAAMASIAAIPIVGPGLAPAAGAAMYADILGTFGSLASAAGGWDMVPQDQLAQVHKNEMILPASIATPMRSMLTNGHVGGKGQGDMHLHSNITIQALDGKSVQQVILQHGDTIGNIAVAKMQKAYRGGKFR